ncbi:MAG: ATP-binding protein, partial [Candidatus Sumerlaeia bacterium]|nr:ATP-binding protein [Candidatus Sumerlaeia bacterium]
FNSPAKKRRIRTALSVPLRAENKIIGVVNVSRESGKKFNQLDLNKMTILAGQAALAIVNARLFEENLQSLRLATIGKVVSAISHDIKNILTGIKGGIWLLSDTVKHRGDSVLESQCELIRRNINRLSLLTLDMLDYCKKREPLLSECDLNSICKEAVDTVRLAKQQKKYEVQMEIDKGLNSVWLDEERILRCLINLIDNAVDALPEVNGKIKITGKLEEYSPGKLFMGHRFRGARRLIVLEISDNGQGINKQDLPLIFEPFYSTKQTKGTGLGLSVSKKIVEEHKGKIFCESEAGKGTIFRLVLPQQ